MRRFGPVHASAGVLVAFLVGTVACAADAKTASPGPRFRGVWQAADPQRLLMPADGSALPFRAAALKLYQRHLAARRKGDTKFDLTSRCSSPGVPRIVFLPYPFEIYERADEVVFVYEFNHLFRQVVTDGSKPAALYPTAMGLATGHWRGDTLIITTRERDAKTLLDDAIPNSESLEVTERLRRTGDVIEDRVTINDPRIFTKPWTAIVHYQLQPHREIAEDVCLDRVAAGRPPIQWP